ncbi:MULTISPECIES: hypothetical protein [unclassified Moraxella]
MATILLNTKRFILPNRYPFKHFGKIHLMGLTMSVANATLNEIFC